MKDLEQHLVQDKSSVIVIMVLTFCAQTHQDSLAHVCVCVCMCVGAWRWGEALTELTNSDSFLQ